MITVIIFLFRLLGFIFLMMTGKKIEEVRDAQSSRSHPHPRVMDIVPHEPCLLLNVFRDIARSAQHANEIERDHCKHHGDDHHGNRRYEKEYVSVNQGVHVTIIPYSIAT
jgi:hypothetical protein